MFKKIKQLFSFGNTLYYPGCITSFVLEDIYENYKKILNKLNIDFITIPEFNCCGSPVIAAGYTTDYNNLIRKNNALFEKYNIKKIITNCPGCYKTLKKQGFDVQHITQVISNNLKKLKINKVGKITYHDPCHLGRYGNVYDEPRIILKHLGLNVVELDTCRDKSMCCGAGGGVKSNFPEMADSTAKKILNKVTTKKFVTPCPMCYAHFKENAKGKDIEIIEFSQLLIK